VRQVELELQNEELHNVQENLEAALEKYSNYYDFAPTGYFTLNEQGIILEVNLRGAGMVKVLRQQLIGTTFSVLVRPEDRPAFNAFFNSVLTTITKQHCELRMLENNAPGIWVLMDGVSSKEPVAGARNLRLTLTDISKRKTVEDKINAQYSILQAVINDNYGLMFSLDRDFLYTSFNNNYARTIKTLYGADIKTGDSILQHMTVPEDRDRIKRSMDRVLAGERFTEESFYGNEAFSRQYFELTYTPIHSMDGRIIGASLYARDITDRKRIESALQNERGKLLGVLEAMNDPACIVNAAFNIEYANPAFEREFGISDAQKCHDFLHNLKGPCPECDTPNTLEGKPATWEWFSPASKKSYECVITPFRNMDSSLSKVEIFRDITERKRLKAALQNAQKFLDASGVIMVSLDKTCAVTLVNKVGAEILECDIKEITGQNWLETYIAEPYRDKTKAVFLKLLANESELPEHLDNVIITKNNCELQFSWTNTALRDDNGAVIGILCSGEDVTERNKIADTLKLNEEKYRAIIESTHEGVWIYNTGYIISFANAQMAEMLGCGLSELVGQSLLDFLSESERNYILQGKDDRRKQGNRERKLYRKDGSFFWALESTSLFLAPNGDHIGILGMVTNITAQKEATETLQFANTVMSRQVEAQTLELSYRQMALEEIYRIAIMTTFSPKMLCDQMVVSLSKLLSVPYLELKIREQDKLTTISKAIKGVLVQEDPFPLHSNLSDRVVESGQVYHVKNQLQQLFPECVCCRQFNLESFIGLPILGKSNELLGALLVLDDKERTFTEDEYHLIGIFTEYLVHEITHIKFEQQMNQDQQMKMLGQLTSGVAHEVRNPLNAIIAVSEAFFQAIGENPEYLPFINHIRDQVKRLSALMTELLELGRPINKSRLSNVSISALLSEVLNSWQHSVFFGKYNIKRLEPSSEKIWLVHADGIKLQQVFSNILQNACQHSPESSEISIQLKTTRDNKIIIKISDAGPGIPPQNLEHIFEPFYTTRKGGIGLGMNIVKHIVEMHGGTIVLYNNTPLPGLTVEVSLPLAETLENVTA